MFPEARINDEAPAFTALRRGGRMTNGEIRTSAGDEIPPGGMAKDHNEMTNDEALMTKPGNSRNGCFQGAQANDKKKEMIKRGARMFRH
jgi:hypothetical protein